MIIYKITNSINGKSYIGQTSRDLETRWFEHIKNSKYQDSVFYRALKKYGKEKFTIKVICYASTVQELNHREQFCIRIFKSQYNSLPGGQDHHHTSITKAKISQSIKKLGLRPWLGKKLPDSVRLKISNTKIKKSQSKGDRNPMFGRRHSKKSIISNAITNGSKKFIVTKNDVIIGEWVVKAQCARELNLSREQVRDCLSGRNKSSKGYIFKYLEE